MTLTGMQTAAEAAKKILGFYPEIPASDPKGFAAGLVELLSLYHPAVVRLASDPARGIPSRIQYLNLAAIRKLLEEFAEENAKDMARREREHRLHLPPPAEPNEEAKARIAKGMAELAEHLKRGFSPGSV